MQHRSIPTFQSGTDSDLIVFSHLRWDFVFQRPQHLLSRFAKHRKVFFFEEPVFCDTSFSHLKYAVRENGVLVATPQLRRGMTEPEINEELASLVDDMIEHEEIENFTSWYYTPMALAFTRHIEPDIVIFDAMDELSAFKGAPPLLIQYEEELMQSADLVFTGGQSLYEAKQHRNQNVYCFPSSIEREHFAKAREISESPVDQERIPGPRVGFYGVLDERFDIELLRRLAELKSDWNFIMIGPVVKIDPAELPDNENIHYLGMKSYQELPRYLAGWDLAILPFARNESTRFISPTKTPEYLSAGRPVVSTSIKDVIRPYQEQGLVEIADHPEEFVSAAELAMNRKKKDPTWMIKVDAFLADKSWDHTANQMMTLERNFRNRVKPTLKNAGLSHAIKGEPVYGSHYKS